MNREARRKPVIRQAYVIERFSKPSRARRQPPIFSTVPERHLAAFSLPLNSTSIEGAKRHSLALPVTCLSGVALCAGNTLSAKVRDHVWMQEGQESGSQWAALSV
jgi:hypothetical protein